MGGHLKRLAALLLFLCAAVASAQNYILTQTLGTPRSDFTGYVGFYFDTAGNTPTVTQLCRWKIAGNSQTHALYLFKYVDGGAGDVQIATASVNLSTGSDGVYACATIGAPVTLLSSTTYYVIGHETSGGDEFYNNDTTADSFTSGIGTFSGDANEDGLNTELFETSGSSIFGPVNLSLSAAPTPTPTPTLTGPTPTSTRTITPTRTNTPTVTVTPTVTTPPCGWTQGHAMRRIGAGTYHATSNDNIIFADGGATIVLPPNPSDCTRLVVKKVAGTGPVIIDGNGHLIDGLNTRAINTLFAAWKLAFQLNFQWGIL